MSPSQSAPTGGAVRPSRSSRPRPGADAAGSRNRPPASSKALQLVQPSVKAFWLPEPELAFANGSRHVDPRTGLSLFGPASLGQSRHRARIRLGFVGLASAIEHARELIDDWRGGVAGGDTHHPYPGLKETFGVEVIDGDDALVQNVTINEHRGLLDTRPERARFEATLALLDYKLRLLGQRDDPPDLIFVVIDPEMMRHARKADYKTGGKSYHRDMRLALKAAAMRYSIPIQLLQETTTRRVPENRRSIDHPTDVAWNLTTGMYFKNGGLPWGPTSLPPDTCFVGVSFYRPLGSVSTLVTSIVQAFDENGEGLVLKGPDFTWDERHEGRSPHLPAEAANVALALVLDRYQQQRGNLPRRVVVHKTSSFEAAERTGFQDALRAVSSHDLVAVTQTSDWRMLRAGEYPPLRGTVVSVGSHAMLYTTGWVPNLGYDHGHVPSPVRIADHVGDTPRNQLLSEILTLTKMNWNSAAFAETMPITLRFSRQVGDILREMPEDVAPQPQYRFYM